MYTGEKNPQSRGSDAHDQEEQGKSQQDPEKARDSQL